jgi:hypothetical protein
VKFGVAAAAMALAAAAVGTYSLLRGDALERRFGVAPREAPVGPSAIPAARDLVLPLPRQGEMALARARALAASGHLREALAVLERVRVTDPQKTEADRMRADLQRQLLELTTVPESSPPGSRSQDRPQP